MSINAIDYQTFNRLYDSGSDQDKSRLFSLINNLVGQTSVLTGAVAPTFKANQHQWYLDTVTSKYYRNVNGGTTWVALN